MDFATEMLTRAWILPAVMASSFLVILLIGKRLPESARSAIGIAAVAICFVLSLVMVLGWVDRVEGPSGSEVVACGNEDYRPNPVEGEKPSDDGFAGEPDGQAIGPVAIPTGESAAAGAVTAAEEGEVKSTVPVVCAVTWFSVGDVNFEFGFLVDGLSVMMLFVVTGISLLVHIYSREYVRNDVRYTHYYAFLSLFTASMLFYVLSSNTLQMLMGWELVGLCSFGLIGHWWEEKKNSDAALKAFITNRVGDVGLLLGIIVVFFAAGATSFNVFHLNEYALSGAANTTLLLVGALLLFGGVTSKSGQFPLHTWLPDAMAGPTPVSALIHAATMVVAGVYLIARLYAVFWGGLEISGSTFHYVAFIGGLTTVVGAVLAFVQNDIKKVLAYSTISQLGFMVMALGVGAWTAGVFHLFTHAFFKAALFLGAGSVSHAAHHTFDMREMGGLRKYMPTTHKTFLVCTLALAGIFPFAGFWSKDEILTGANAGAGGWGVLHHAGHGHAHRPAHRRLHGSGLPHDLLGRVPRPRHPARVAAVDDGAAGDLSRCLPCLPGSSTSRSVLGSSRPTGLKTSCSPRSPSPVNSRLPASTRSSPSSHLVSPSPAWPSHGSTTSARSACTASPPATGRRPPATSCWTTSSISMCCTPTPSSVGSRARWPGPPAGSTAPSSTVWSMAPGWVHDWWATMPTSTWIRVWWTPW